MYCSSCGMAVTPGLSYCNQCGARLSGANRDDITKSSEVKAETLVGAIAAVFIFGLGAIIGLMMALKMVFGIENLGLVIAFTFLSFMILLAVEGVFIGMLLSRKKRAKEAGDTERLKKQTTKELSEAKARMLQEPALSVTEHTTRTLEPVDRTQTTE
jgi:hypothetical protein